MWTFDDHLADLRSSVDELRAAIVEGRSHRRELKAAMADVYVLSDALAVRAGKEKYHLTLQQDDAAGHLVNGLRCIRNVAIHGAAIDSHQGTAPRAHVSPVAVGGYPIVVLSWLPVSDLPPGALDPRCAPDYTAHVAGQSVLATFDGALTYLAAKA